MIGVRFLKIFVFNLCISVLKNRKRTIGIACGALLVVANIRIIPKTVLGRMNHVEEVAVEPVVVGRLS